MARAGSFVAERILGTSGSSVLPLLLILITRPPPSEDKTSTSQQKPEDVSCKIRTGGQEPGLSQCLRCAARPLLCRPTNPLFHASFRFSRPGLLRSQLMIGEHLITCHGWSKYGVLFMGEIILRQTLQH